MDPYRSHRLVHVINNCERPGQYNTNITFYPQEYIPRHTFVSEYHLFK